MSGVGGRREMSPGSSVSLLLRQNFKAVFIVGNPQTTGTTTERTRTTRRFGAVLTYERAAVTEDVIRHRCLPVTVMMLLM
jgi:hypothetical protein